MPKIQFTNTRRILRPTMISAKNLKEPSIPLPKCFKTANFGFAYNITPAHIIPPKELI